MYIDTDWRNAVLPENKRKFAFTLAEVLITLGIIGVVAALTMPSLIAKHQEKAAVARLKKAYSILSQAMLLAINEYGTIDGWESYSYDDPDESDDTVIRISEEFLVKQLSVAKDCGHAKGCFASPYKTLKGTTERDFENLDNRYYKLILADGISLALEGYEWGGNNCTGVTGKGNCGEIWIDINGKKNPNTVGKDLFLFTYNKNGKISPYESNTYNTALKNTTCRTNSNGYSCAGWVLAFENLDYLHCDDLSWVGKTRCK